MNKIEFIKQIRKKYKMSQKNFAEYLGISKSLIEKIEMGKSPAVPHNKYIKAISALEGLDNEIFKYDEITEEILKEYKLTKFSKAFRKFLFFFYGDFWNEDIIVDVSSAINKKLVKYLIEKTINKTYLEDETDLIHQSLFDFLYDNPVDKLNPKKLSSDELIIFDFIKIMIIISIEKFKVSEFEDIDKLVNFLEKNKDVIIEKIENYKNEDNYIFPLIELKVEKLKSDLMALEDNGVPLTIENIRKLKKEKTIKETNDNLVEIKDDKDKQILELLPYAPPAFKDKIIEKLKKFKDEVENL